MSSVTFGLSHDLVSSCAAEVLRRGGFRLGEVNLRSFPSPSELQSALLTGEIDAVLISHEAVEAIMHPALKFNAVLPRLDIRTILLLQPEWRQKPRLKAGCAADSQVKVIASFLSEALPRGAPDFDWSSEPDRLAAIQKFAAGQLDALALPKYLLELLLETSQAEFASVQADSALQPAVKIVLPISEVPAAPGAGAACLVTLADNHKINIALQVLDCPATRAALREERRTIAELELNPLFACVTSLCLPFGYLTYVRAKQNRSGQIARQIFVQSGTPLPRTEAQKLFPLDEKEAQLFEREPIGACELPDLSNRGLWIAKADALPEAISIPASAVVWTAGVKSWKRLAARGVLVHGSADGLGEEHGDPAPSLFPQISGWLKFSHADGVPTPDRQLLSTYRLVPKAQLPDLSQRTHFFWSSGSAFALALSKQPQIKPRWHASGPGHTHRAIVAALGGSERVRIFPDYSTWRSEVVL